MITVSEKFEVSIDGKPVKMPKRLCRALSFLVKGPAKELIPGRDYNNQKVCANHLRQRLDAYGYDVICFRGEYHLTKGGKTVHGATI